MPFSFRDTTATISPSAVLRQGRPARAACKAGGVSQRAVERIGRERAVVVHLDCPVEVCRTRDADGHYALADAGTMSHFPGVSAPYEPPVAPDLVLPTHQWPVGRCVDVLVKLLEDRGAI